MKRDVVLSSTAKEKLELLLNYLEKEFSVKTKNEFIAALEKTSERISKYPESSPHSRKVKSVRRSIVSKYTVLYYRIEEERIEIITFFDTRQNPEKEPF